MDFTHFTIMQDGSAIGSSAALPQAVATATHHAADTGRPVTVMAHVVGGGANASYLNELTAKETGRTVCAGPTEATAIGNLAAQMIAGGEAGSLKEVRKCIFDSFAIETYQA